MQVFMFYFGSKETWVWVRIHNTATTQCKDTTLKIWKIIPEKKLCGLNPNFNIHVSVSDLYIPTIGLPILLQ